MAWIGTNVFSHPTTLRSGRYVCRPCSKSYHTSLFRKDFCLIPIGTGQNSVAEEIAECQRVLAKTGLKYKVDPFFTCPLFY